MLTGKSFLFQTECGGYIYPTKWERERAKRSWELGLFTSGNIENQEKRLRNRDSGRDNHGDRIDAQERRKKTVKEKRELHKPNCQKTDSC